MNTEAEGPLLQGKKIGVGVTGGIAAYKAADLVSSLVKLGADVHVIMTAHAAEFVSPLVFRALTGNPVRSDMFAEPQEREISHISLPSSLDLLVIAPATANIIGKLAHGIADDWLSTAALVVKCRILIAPAMNANMYTNPVVVSNMDRLKALGYEFIAPETGRLACGTEGVGRLADVHTIVDRICSVLTGARKDFAEVRFLITAGPTREPIDPVRYLSNYSSGKMGYALAEAAANRGAAVTVVSGPAEAPPPANVEIVPVVTAKEMHEAVSERFADADVIICAAAVADFTPSARSPQKIKKSGKGLTLQLDQTPDILGHMGELKGKRLLVGFAAETENLLKNAEAKLRSKHADLVVANEVGNNGNVFGSDTNQVTLVYASGETECWPRMSKREVANRLLDVIKRLLSEERV